MDILLDTKNKPTDEFFHFYQNPRWPPAVKGSKSAKFDPANHISARHLDPVLSIRTKCSIDILLNPRNKPAKEFFFYRQIQDAGWRPPLWKVTKSSITQKLYKLDTHFFLDLCFMGKECNEAIIVILRSQQIP